MGLAKVGIAAGLVFGMSPGVALALSLSVTQPAAFTGSYGLEVDFVSGSAEAYVQDDTPAAEPRYRVRLYVHADLAGPGPFEIPIFGAYSVGVSSSVRIAGVTLERAGAASPLGLRFIAREDDGTPRSVGPYPVAAGWHAFEIDWQVASGAGSNDGSLDVWIDDVQMPGMNDLDNDQAEVDAVRIGKTGPSTATGSFYLDDFVSTRDTYIGLVPDPSPPTLIFKTGFETGDASDWSLAVGLTPAVPVLGWVATLLTSLLLSLVSLRMAWSRGTRRQDRAAAPRHRRGESPMLRARPVRATRSRCSTT